MKRTALRRDTPKARAWIKRGRSQLDRKTRVNPVSAKRRAAEVDRAKVRRLVLSRAEYRCQLREFFPTVRCFGPMTVHHLRKASQGGPYSPENLVAACARHNDLVEDTPDYSRSVGLVR